ncbi:hypothetical protein LUZ60_011156 [Juncus effusus]|nr:hypothetical protein LUZ60_011156 [Juncus effusus]
MELLSLHSFLFLLLPLLAFLYLFTKPTKNETTKSYPILGHLPELFKNRDRFLSWLTEILIASPNRTITLRVPGRVNRVITGNPKNVEYMLKSNFDNFPKGDVSITVVEDFFGHGIFSSDGDHWLWQRKATSMEFNKKSFRNIVTDTVQKEIFDRLLPLLEKTARNSETIDFEDVIERFAFDTICVVVFEEDPGLLTERGVDGERGEFMKAFREAQELLMERFEGLVQDLWKVKRMFDIGSEKRFRESLEMVHSFGMRIVQKQKGKSSEGDLLSRFKSNKSQTEEQLRDTVTSFLIGGTETTTSALIWFFYLVSTNPSVLTKIEEEISSIRSTKQNPHESFTLDELRRMHYLHASITESMRLYPPISVDNQSCKESDILPDGTIIKKGWFMAYSAYAMARMEELWGKDCKEYKPERWLENGVFKPENPFKYPVFHAGPRVCLGKEMAYIEMKMVASCLLEKFEFVYVGKDKVPEPLLSLTLKMKGGMPVQVRNKKNN